MASNFPDNFTIIVSTTTLCMTCYFNWKFERLQGKASKTNKKFYLQKKNKQFDMPRLHIFVYGFSARRYPVKKQGNHSKLSNFVLHFHKE